MAKVFENIVHVRHTRVRKYQVPLGRVDDLEMCVDPESASLLEQLASRSIYPAVEFLSTGLCSVTLEDDDREMDLACEIVLPKNVRATLLAMIRRLSSEKPVMFSSPSPE